MSSGADPVAYFTLHSGDSYVMGSEEYSTTLNGYTFWFSTEENLKTFISDPWTYAPAFGGFCSWGMSEETAPEYNWGPTTLGPAVDLNLWYIHSRRLFLFYKDEAMDKFLEDPDTYLKDGNSRWTEWFGSTTTSPFNTACYVSNDDESMVKDSRE
jgi:YHS domain-containing protein